MEDQYRLKHTKPTVGPATHSAAPSAQLEWAVLAGVGGTNWSGRHSEALAYLN